MRECSENYKCSVSVKDNTERGDFKVKDLGT